MNYAVMYDYAINRDSGQFKAPFNQIANSHALFTYKDTAVVTPNSDTPYSICWMDLRAEPLVISVPAVDPKRYYSVQLIDGNTYNYGYIGSRATGSEAGDYLVVGPGLEGRGAGRRQEGLPLKHDLLGRHLPHAALRSGGHGERDQAAGRLQGPAALGLSQAAGAAARPQRSISRRSTSGLAKTNFFDYLAFMIQFVPPMPNEDDIRADLAKIGVGPGKPSTSRIAGSSEAVDGGRHEGWRPQRIDDCGRSLGEERQRLAGRPRGRRQPPPSTATG